MKNYERRKLRLRRGRQPAGEESGRGHRSAPATRGGPPPRPARGDRRVLIAALPSDRMARRFKTSAGNPHVRFVSRQTRTGRTATVSSPGSFTRYFCPSSNPARRSHLLGRLRSGTRFSLRSPRREASGIQGPADRAAPEDLRRRVTRAPDGSGCSPRRGSTLSAQMARGALDCLRTPFVAPGHRTVRQSPQPQSSLTRTAGISIRWSSSQPTALSGRSSCRRHASRAARISLISGPIGPASRSTRSMSSELRPGESK